AGAENDAIHSTNMPALKLLADSRSSYARLPKIKAPVYMFQGRVDYAFDVTQAVNGYTRVAGPKHLYVGQFGHTPSTFPGPEGDQVPAPGRHRQRRQPRGHARRHRPEGWPADDPARELRAVPAEGHAPPGDVRPLVVERRYRLLRLRGRDVDLARPCRALAPD